MNFDDIFVNTDTVTREPLSLEDETKLIARSVEESGQRRQPSFDRLMWQYIPALRGRVASEYRRTGGSVDIDDIRSNVLAGFVDAVHSTRPGAPLAQTLENAIYRASDETNAQGAIAVPAQRRREYTAAMRDAEGNLENAIELTRGKSLSETSMRTIHAALNGADSIDSEAAQAHSVTDPYESVDMTLEVARALKALAEAGLGSDSKEFRVIVRAFGFGKHEPLTDVAIAEDLAASGSGAGSRATVGRTRERAVRMMHDALCDGTDLRCNRTH